MPVHFQGMSEYDSKYQKFASHKSASFVPVMEQALPAAGRATIAAASKCEPPIPQKKRVTIAPGSSLNSEFFSQSDVTTSSNDYILLGNQDKFNNNVKYWNRTTPQNRDVSPAKIQKMYTEPPGALNRNRVITPAPVIQPLNYNEPHDIVTPLAPRKVQTSELVDVNKNTNSEKENGASKLKADKIKLILEKEQLDKDNIIMGKKHDFGSKIHGKNMESVNDNRKVSTIREKADVGDKHGDLKISEKDRLKRYAELNRGILDRERELLSRKELVKEPMIPKAVLKKSPPKPEFLDRNANAVNGVDDVIENNYALQYKAGISKPRKGPKRQTEYQREFEWKTSVKSSPLLDAVQIVHGSQSDSPNKPSMKADTEYSRQYKAWQYVPVNQSRPNVEEEYRAVGVKAPESAVAKRKKPKRSKSAESINDRPAGLPSQKGDNRAMDALDIRETDDIEHKMKKLRKKHRHLTSEYNSNYRSPSQYQNGSCKDTPKVEINKQSSPESTRSWFSEVLELREKAAEYRRRAQGTHFSREHLVQLMAQQTKLWEDMSSRSGSVVEMGSDRGRQDSTAKDTEHSHVQQSELKIPEFGHKRALPHDHRVNRRLLASEMKDDRRDQKQQNGWESPKSLSTNSQESATHKEIIQHQEGRIPTPELQTDSSRRHHLDRTTPSVGGALLVSPKSNRSVARRYNTWIQPVIKDNYKEDIVEDSGDNDTLVEDETPRTVTPPSTPPLQRPPRLNLDAVRSPTFGSPSYDSHCLRDDDASTDRPLQTKYLRSPLKDITPIREPANTEPAYKGRYISPSLLNKQPDRHTDGHNHYAYSKDHKPLSKDRLRLFQQINNADDSLPYHADDDQMSTSARSVGSSCSLASDVLERAKKRRDFWSHDPGHHQTR